MLRLVGLDRMVSVYPSLDAAAAARLPAAAVARAEGVPGRGSEDSTAAQQAHLRMLDAVITGLFQVELGLQAALGQPADPARKRTGEALDDLTDVIGEIRAIVSAARGQPPAPPRGDWPKAGELGGLAPGSPLSARMVMRADDRAGRIGTDVDRMLRIWHDDLAWMASCHPGISGDRCRPGPR